MAAKNRDKYRTRLEPGRKTLRNERVLNAWGLALHPAGAGGHWWIANTDSAGAENLVAMGISVNK